MPVVVSQLASVVHIKLNNANDFSLPFDYNVSLTGWTITPVVHPADGSSDVSFAVANTDLAAGQFSISLTKAQVTALGVGEHTWCLNMVNVSAQERTYHQGKFIIEDCG